MISRTDDWAALLQRAPAEAIPEGLPGRWWVAHTKPRHEKALAQDLAGREIPCYLPLTRRLTVSRTNGRRMRSIVPVFTGYLFFNATETQRVRALATNRIANLLDVPAEAELVRELRQIQQVLAGGEAVECGPAIAVGDWARVIAGPLAGVTGLVTRRLARLRLVLNVRMLAQSVSVEVPQELLELTEPPGEAERSR